MTYTRSQLHERISDLSGQYRAAQENKRLTSQKRAEDERLADLSRQADEKADGHLLEIAAQINEAKAQYAAAVDELIAPASREVDWGPDVGREVIKDCPNHGRAISSGPSGGHICDECGGEYVLQFNSIFTEGADFQAAKLDFRDGQEKLDRVSIAQEMIENAESRVNGAFERATR